MKLLKKLLSASQYYVTSIPLLILHTSFWRIPLVFFYKPLLFTVKPYYKFYVESLMDIWILKEILLDKQYHFSKQLTQESTVVDIGAGIGDFDVFIAKKVKWVYAFESNRERLNLARKNIILNRCKNITLISCKVKNLEEVLKKYKITRCDLLKVDCEGCEYQIFKDVSQDTLSHIQQVVMEIHLFNNEMRNKFYILKKQLLQRHFKIKEIDNPVHSYLKLVYAWK